MIPNRIAAIMQIKENPHTHKKLLLMCWLMSTSARPTPRSVAGTIGLMKVAQFLQTAIAAAIGSAGIPKPSSDADHDRKHSVEVAVGVER